MPIAACITASTGSQSRRVRSIGVAKALPMRDAREHAREHDRERVGGRSQEDDQHPEPDNLER